MKIDVKTSTNNYDVIIERDILNKVKDFMLDKVNKFKNLSNAKKLSLIIAVVAVIIAIVFGMKYINNSKYQVLFSGLSSTDAANITGELENEKVDMKIKGDIQIVNKKDSKRNIASKNSSCDNSSFSKFKPNIIFSIKLLLIICV